MRGIPSYPLMVVRPSKTSERHLQEAGVGFAPEACWPWPGGQNGDGYGRYFYSDGDRRRNVVVTRVVLARKLGRDLLPTELACHTCDNPPCVNPAHLFVGSSAINLADMRLKGRQQKKVTDEQVQQIRSRFAAGGVLQRELAAEYGVNQTQISRLVRSAWVPGEPRPRGDGAK